MKPSIVYQKIHTDLMRLGNDIEKLRDKLHKMQEESHSLANLHMHLEEIRQKRYNIAEEFKVKHKKYLAARKAGRTKKEIDVLEEDMIKTRRAFKHLTPEVKSLRRRVKAEEKEYKRTRSKVKDYFQDFSKSTKKTSRL